MSATAHSSLHTHSAWQSAALQAIFAVFLGIIVAVVVGVAVGTLHPNPADETRAQLETLYQQQDPAKAVPTSTPDERALQARIMALETVARDQEQAWAASASLIVIGCATVLLGAAVALARQPQMWVFSTGLLLGGIFTMLYAVAISFMAAQSLLRLGTLLVALVITCGLGYLRFVRGRNTSPVTEVAADGTADAPTAALDERVRDLEHSMGALRNALRT